MAKISTVNLFFFGIIFLGIGNITKCCEYEMQDWEDIWDVDRTIRLGRVIYNSRVK